MLQEFQKYGYYFVPFGKYKGCQYACIPVEYKQWLVDNEVLKNKDIHQYLILFLEDLKQKLKSHYLILLR